MRTADVIFHKPSGEKWKVAFVEDGRLTACGWPCSTVPVTDCELIRAADDVEHNKLLEDMAAMSSDDPRRSYAIRMIATRNSSPSP